MKRTYEKGIVESIQGAQSVEELNRLKETLDSLTKPVITFGLRSPCASPKTVRRATREYEAKRRELLGIELDQDKRAMGVYGD